MVMDGYCGAVTHWQAGKMLVKELLKETEPGPRLAKLPGGRDMCAGAEVLAELGRRAAWLLGSFLTHVCDLGKFISPSVPLR